jgi:hypothetical protein
VKRTSRRDDSGSLIEEEVAVEYLYVQELPDRFEDRYGKIPSHIYIRKCYCELYCIATDKILGLGESARSVTLFTGVPGIGKSLFLIYFIFRFLKDERFTDKTFALELQSKSDYSVFHPTDNPTVFKVNDNVNAIKLGPKKFFLFCDLSSREEPFCRAQQTLIFSSPDPCRYKEITKNAPSFNFTMPTWEENELMFVGESFPNWEKNFISCGGVPRLVLSDFSIDKVDKAIDEKGGSISENFFKFGHGSIDILQNYCLVHINPPVSESGIVKYDGRIVYSFASDEIFQKLACKYHQSILAAASQLFDVGAAPETFGSSSAGHLFENVCLWLKPLEGLRLSTIDLQNTSILCEFDVPTNRKLLDLHWKKNLLEPNYYYVPRIKNFMSGDSFYCMQCVVDQYLLVIFQITVAESHPVKARGLLDIFFAFPEDIRSKITRKVIIFVTPNHGKLYKVQRLTTMKGETSLRIPGLASDFLQFAYRHKLN